VRSHAKASTAGSTSGNGESAPSLGCRLAVLAFLLAFGSVCLLPGAALAAPEHSFLENFGSAAQPSFGEAAGMALDPATGDLLVIDLEDQTLSRFKPNGEPDPFSALGTHVIDGHAGGEDETPDGDILSTEVGLPIEAQVAVAPPGSAGGTAGNIYVTDAFSEVVDIFESTGKYIGQISGEYPCGVAVDPSGTVYVGDYLKGVQKLVPTAPATFGPATGYPVFLNCQVAAGAQPLASGGSEGFVFATAYEGAPISKIDSEGAEEGEVKYTVSAGENTTVGVDPATGHVYAAKGEEVVEYDASGASSATEVTSISLDSAARGVAINGTSGNVYTTRSGNAEVEVYGPLLDPAIATTKPADTIHHTSAVLHGHLDPGGDPETTDCYFDWGTTVAYGNTVDCNEGDSFSSAADVSANLGNLTPATTIHFRLHISTTSSGDVTGANRKFTPSPFPSGHVFTGTVGSAGTGDGQFSGNTGIGVDQSTGDIYVADTANHRIEKLDSDGNFLAAWGWGVDDGSAAYQVCTSGCQAGISGLGPGQFAQPSFVAVDNSEGPSAGSVYVGDRGDFNLLQNTTRVQKFDSSGNLVTTWGSGGQLNGSAAPHGPFSSNMVGTTVDTAGNLAVGSESGGGTISLWRFAQDASYLSVFVLGGINANGNFPGGLAVDSAGNFFDVAGNGNSTDGTHAAMIDPTGEEVGRVNKVGGIKAIAVDPATDDLFVANPGFVHRYHFFGANVIEPDSSNCPILKSINSGEQKGCDAAETFGSGDLVAASGVAVHGSSGRVYVSDSNTIRIFDRGAPTSLAPTLTPGTPTAIAGASATLNAKVDPETFAVTDCHFEYGTSAAYGQSVPCTPAPGSGSGDVAVSADISGLNGGTVHHFRIVASNTELNGTALGPDQTFTTLGPKISAQSVKDVSFSGAAVVAKIKSEGEKTTYHVEYGTTSSYGQSTPESLPIGFEGDNSEHTVSVHIGDLAAGATYHFRFVADNADGTTNGADTTLSTYSASPAFPPCPNDPLRSGLSARLPDCRAYEQATPVDKHGANIQGSVNRVQVSSAGDRITFYLNGGLPTSDGSSTLSAFAASRGASGWSSAGLLPATAPGLSANVVGWSEDLSTAAVSAPGPGAAGTALYLRESDSGAFQQSGPVQSGGFDGMGLAGFAADTSHLILESSSSLLPEAATGKPNLYDLNHGTLSLAGRIPAGSATSCDDEAGPACIPAPEGSVAGPYDWQGSNLAAGGPSRDYYTQNTISRDGSKVFFTAAGSGQLYLREDGTKTIQVSASQAAVPDPNGHKPAAFLAATPDGSKVFFMSCEKLTDDSTAVSTAANSCTTQNQGQDLYSYDTGSGELTDLSVDTNASDAKGAAVKGMLGISADGSYVYFAANGVLAPGAAPGNCQGSSCNLYLSHEGTTTFVASLAAEKDLNDWRGNSFGSVEVQKTSRVSADGRTLLFSSIQSLTGYDNVAPSGACQVTQGGSASCAELFRYSAEDEGLICVSCNPTGAPPSSDAVLGTNRFFLSNPPSSTFLTRNLSADGKRVFFESKDALLSTDINGVNDVYEWEAEGSGTCQTPDGCLYLISSGTSPNPTYFADASADGDHVFFFTDQQLVPSDRDQLVDLYDAGVEGGLPSQHPLAPPTCNSTACQANPAPPPEQTPASASFSGPGNAQQRSKARGCPKGKRKVRRAGKVRCQKAHKQHKRHNNRGGSK
jgi:NHL repeat